MIPIKLQIFLIVISLFGTYCFINMIIKYKLDLKYSLLWIFSSVLTFLLAIFPQMSLVFTNWLGIEKPVNLIFLSGIVFIISILFSLTLTISNNQARIKQLSQELGLLRYEYNQFKKELEQLTSEQRTNL
ncbi:DUF2304 domain-containing protein [Paenibacillus caseinilyticus]|uniref:DUF2304 domain-containing protein n=1 Tax=Paenibacillus mucilaginosus K02 TaxID=997761 RepID=I0BBC6_9BACL|nr:hypothetical protein B2K_02850 [Paenibacillus mucilaginosus K02]